MNDPSSAFDVEMLLGETAWVRALARHLAGPGATAEDLEQSTWLAALEHRPGRGASLRSWLATVLRNAARQELRGRGRRTARESDAARSERVPSTTELLERAEMHERLAAAVRALAEPYRTAILLRFFESLPPRHIAARLGVPVATVRTRVARGLAQLRERLDRDFHGDRRAWIVVLAPLASPPPPHPLLVTALAMNAKLVASIAVVVSLAGLGWWFAANRGAAPEEQRVVAAGASASTKAPPRPVGEDLAPLDGPGEAASRAVVREPERGSVAAAAIERAAGAVRGRVLDANGAPAAGVRLIARSAESEGAPPIELELVSAGDGSFEIAGAAGAGAVVSGDRRFATVLRARFRAGDGAREPIVVVAPRVDLGGEVVDETGAPLEGAEVSIDLPDDFRARFREVLDASATETWSAQSDERGAFEIDGAAAIEGATLTARADGFAAHRGAVPGLTDLALRIVLARPRSEDGWVRGLVLDGNGVPLPGARVALGIDTLRTSDDGRFAFRIDDPESFGRRVGFEADAIVALAPGRMPARYEPPREAGEPVWPSLVTLRLIGETLAITGRVVDAEGEPMAGVRAFVADATLFGAIDGGPRMVETLLAGQDELWSWVETDAGGAFAIEGLLDREYVVRAHDPRTLLRADSEAVRAGRRGVEIRLPTDQLYPRVAGRVLSRAGRPVEGATVHPMCDAFQAHMRGGETIATSHDALEGTRTDAQGRFELRDVPRSLVYLRVDGESILPLEYGRYVEGDRRFAEDAVKELPVDRIESLELRVELRCHVQVELADAGFADELAVLDAKGNELVVSLFVGEGRRERQRHPIHAGRSDVLGVPDTAEVLVLFKEGSEVARTKLAPDPSKLVTVRM